MMNVTIDLHIHTHCSDGTLSPSEAVDICAQAGLRTVAISDHDTLIGVQEAREHGEKLGVEVIPAIEMSTGGRPEIHILGYYADSHNQELATWLDELRSERKLRAARIVNRLQEQGLRIALDDVREQADHEASLSRMHIARALVLFGYAKDIGDAFQKYLKQGKAGYIARNNPMPREMIARLLSFSMVPVLAHGAIMGLEEYELAQVITSLTSYGLMGLECYHSAYTPQMESFMRRQAQQHGLLVTGGSDYHGDNRKNVLPGEGVERWRDVQACLEKLKEAGNKLRNNP